MRVRSGPKARDMPASKRLELRRRRSRGVGRRCETATTATGRAGLEAPLSLILRELARSARWHASCSKGEHEPCDFADRAAPCWTHDDGVAPLSKESQPSLLAAAAVRGRSGDAAGAGASDAASARRTAALARSGAVPRARQQPPGEDLSPRGAEDRAPGERRPQQATAAVPRRRAVRLAAAALRLHVPGGLLRHLPGDRADPVDRRQDSHRGAVHDHGHGLGRPAAVAALQAQPRRQGDRARARDRPRGRSRGAPEGRGPGAYRVLRPGGDAGGGRRAARDGEDAHRGAAGHGAVRGAADGAARGRARGGRAPAQEPLRAVRRPRTGSPRRGRS